MDPMKMDMEQGMMGPWLAGTIYHYLIGISFTLLYILLVGKGSTKLGVLFGILIWIGIDGRFFWTENRLDLPLEHLSLISLMD
jgi:hypothetical protein